MEQYTTLSTLIKTVRRPKKRLGRGHGSGKVKTAGRGTKGQNTKESVRLGFEGGQLPLIKRVPFLRGKGRNSSQKGKIVPVQLAKLTLLPAKTIVTLDLLRKNGMIGEEVTCVKILGSGPIHSALTVEVPCSKTVQSAIEKAGGNVTYG